MVTDVDAADTRAYCQQHFLAMCIDVINAAVEAMPDEPEPGEPEPDEPLVTNPANLTGLADGSTAAEQERKTRRKLAARPDGAATSETVAPWPGGIDSGATD